jgi:hypothetical protein
MWRNFEAAPDGPRRPRRKDPRVVDDTTNEGQVPSECCVLCDGLLFEAEVTSCCRWAACAGCLTFAASMSDEATCVVCGVAHPVTSRVSGAGCVVAEALLEVPCDVKQECRASDLSGRPKASPLHHGHDDHSSATTTAPLIALIQDPAWAEWFAAVGGDWSTPR